MPNKQWLYLNFIADYAFLVLGCLAMLLAIYKRRRHGNWDRLTLVMAAVGVGIFIIFRVGAKFLGFP